MSEDWKWFIGIGVSITTAYAGILVGAFRSILTRISKAEGEARKQVVHLDGKTTEAVTELHRRVNRVREDTVHKSDLTEMSARVSSELREMREANAKAHTATNARLDQLLAAIADRNATPHHNQGD